LPGPRARAPLSARVNRLGSLLLLTRPYSWIDAVLTVLLGAVWTGRPLSSSMFLEISGIGLMLWFSLNWISETVQRDPGRYPPNWLMSTAPLLIAGVWAYRISGGASLPWLVAYIVLAFAYPWKARLAIVGPLGPIMRGLQTGLLFMIGLSVGGTAARAYTSILISLALIQASRSLVADIRDWKTDRYELPQLIGNRHSKWVAASLLATGMALLFHGGQYWAFLVMAGTLAIIAAAPTWLFYEAHLFFIITFPIAKMGIYARAIGGANDTNLMMMLASSCLVLLLSITYVFVPRRSNVSFSLHLRRLAQILEGRHSAR